MFSRLVCLLPLILLLSACGGAQREEAARLSQTLVAQYDAFAKVNASENKWLAEARAWCSPMITGGAGKPSELDARADEALKLAEATNAVSAEISAFRKSLADIPLAEEATGSIRAGLLDQMSARQRALYELKVLLEESAPALRSLKNESSYKGQSYPGAVGRLNDKLLGHRVREGTLEEAVAEIKEKFQLTG